MEFSPNILEWNFLQKNISKRWKIDNSSFSTNFGYRISHLGHLFYKSLTNLIWLEIKLEVFKILNKFQEFEKRKVNIWSVLFSSTSNSRLQKLMFFKSGKKGIIVRVNLLSWPKLSQKLVFWKKFCKQWKKVTSNSERAKKWSSRTLVFAGWRHSRKGTFLFRNISTIQEKVLRASWSPYWCSRTWKHWR